MSPIRAPLHSSLGLARGNVRIVDYDPRWPDLYEEAARELRHGLGSTLIAIEHYGSTAVADLCAKPIIDVLAAVADINLLSHALFALGRLGYEYRPLDTVTDRRFFARGPETSRTHNLSICVAGSRYWRDRIAFRDALRADKHLALKYAALKQHLALLYPRDRLSYTDAKEAFIVSIISSSRDQALL